MKGERVSDKRDSARPGPWGLGGRTRTAPDPLERSAPAFELTDPSAAQARHAVTSIGRGQLPDTALQDLVIGVSEVFRRRQKEGLVRAASVMAIWGLATVGLTVSAAVFLVTSYVASDLAAALITAFVACVFGVLWFAFPLARRH